MTAGETFLNNPMETPVLKAWSRVHAALPGFIENMLRLLRKTTLNTT